MNKSVLMRRGFTRLVPQWYAGWVGPGEKPKAGQRPTEVSAAAQLGGVVSTWTLMGAAGLLESSPAWVELKRETCCF